MKNLLLTSSFVDVSGFLKNLVGEQIKDKSLTFIPTASFPEAYKGYVENDRNAFKKLGLRIEDLDISAVPAEKIREIIRKNDFLYVSGGNTFYLLQELKKSGAELILFDEISKGKPYIGASAGSVILSADIAYIGKMDDRTKAGNLTDSKALGLVDFYILPHYGNPPFKEVAEEVLSDYAHKIRLLPISNTEAVLVKGEQISLLGRN